MAIAANPSGKSFRSLRTRIVVGLVASVWLVLGLYSVLTIVYRQDQLESALQDRSQRLVTLMAGALAFVQPSPYESLSIVLLEAMAQGTPAIVNGRCEVLVDHVEASGSGLVFRGTPELVEAIRRVVALDPATRSDWRGKARDYVLARYSRDQVKARLAAEVEALAAG